MIQYTKIRQDFTKDKEVFYMKKQKGVALLNLIIIIVIIVVGVILLSNLFNDKTKISTELLASEVQERITTEWRQKGVTFTVLEDMILVKKNDNEYSGSIKIMYEGKEILISGTVIYDGQAIQWQPNTQDLFLQLWD